MGLYGSMKNLTRFALGLAVLSAPFLMTLYAPGAETAATKGEYFVYVGSGAQKQSRGIYAFRFDAATGQLTSLGRMAECDNPSFLAVGPNPRFLYSVNETSHYGGQSSGGVSAFAINPATGMLTLLNEVSSGGAGPTHLVVDKTGKDVLVANYFGGSLAVFPILKDGRLGEASAFVQHHGSSVNPQRQEGPHTHSVYTSPDNRFAISADLGLDKVLVYRFDAAKGTITPNDPPFAKVKPGAGPRHFAFHPNGKFGYVINEMGSTVTVFSYEPASGTLRELQTISTLPPDFKGENYPAEVEVHSSGKFLYGSNRGYDSIAVFSIDRRKGTLTPVECVPTGGKSPRNFAIDPTGSYLFAANSGSDNIKVFRIDPNSGRLTPTGQVLEAPAPNCVTFVATE